MASNNPIQDIIQLSENVDDMDPDEIEQKYQDQLKKLETSMTLMSTKQHLFADGDATPSTPTTPKHKRSASSSSEFYSYTDVQELTPEDDEIWKSYDPEAESIKYQDADYAAQNDGNKNVLLEFIKELRPGLEMYRMSVPAFIIQRCSLLEKISCYDGAPNTELFPYLDDANELVRFLAVLRHFLTSAKSIFRFSIGGVKPFNPILGEQFHATWKHKNNTCSSFVGEQVLHHPPVSAFQCRNDDMQYFSYGWLEPKTSFSMNSFSTTMDGLFAVDLKKYGEVYECSQPAVKCGGILIGRKVVYLSGKMILKCEKLGLQAVLDFTEKSKQNIVSGQVFRGEGKKKEVLVEVSGVVHDKVYYEDVCGRLADFKGFPNAVADEKSKKMLLYDCSLLPQDEKVVTPVHLQEKIMSRRVWHQACKHLVKQDYRAAQEQKSIVESRERALKKDQKTWVPTYFEKDSASGHWLPIKDIEKVIVTNDLE